MVGVFHGEFLHCAAFTFVSEKFVATGYGEQWQTTELLV